MLKLNKKGFMMAEVIVTSTIVIAIITGLYASYAKIYGLYKQRINYYDVNTLYKVGYYRDKLIDSEELNEHIKNCTNYIHIDSEIDTSDKLYLVKTNKIDSIPAENPTFKEYIKYLSDALETKANYVMIMESCKEEDNCKYAYLEIYDGNEVLN